MKKTLLQIAAVIPIGLLVWAAYLIFSAPAEPAFDWRLHMTAAGHDAIVSRLNHAFTVAAYATTWGIQLGYVVWLGLKWQAQKQKPSLRDR